MSEIVITTALLALIVVAALLIAVSLKAKQRKSHHSDATMLRFASKAAMDVLASNWEKEEYYSRLYVYASPELASHMQSNKSLLYRVLDERKELLADFVAIKNLEIKQKGFQLIPSQVFEIEGILNCKNGTVPLAILVNAGKELSLDGIKIDKRAFVKTQDA